ncbi:hypothetical protein [Phocaeicola sartorii]|uniref:hypothetical protein n=1 Tax=Phocaeicola sartorii TaxID=671267 RepID=UPI003F68C5C8
MREMLNILLSFFRLDNGKEQPNISPCRISAIIHTLETEFMPIAMNKGLAMDNTLSQGCPRPKQIKNVSCKSEIICCQNAIKFTEEGGVSRLPTIPMEF